MMPRPKMETHPFQPPLQPGNDPDICGWLDCDFYRDDPIHIVPEPHRFQAQLTGSIELCVCGEPEVAKIHLDWLRAELRMRAELRKIRPPGVGSGFWDTSVIPQILDLFYPPEPEPEEWPDGMEMIRQLRRAVGLFAGASSISPKQAWTEALERVRVVFGHPIPEPSSRPPHFLAINDFSVNDTEQLNRLVSAHLSLCEECREWLLDEVKRTRQPVMFSRWYRD